MIKRLLFVFLLIAAPLAAQQLTPAEKAAIDSSANAVLSATGAPGASIAIVRGGEIVYEQAYGGVKPSMRFEIGSVSKQFTASAILLLAEEGKLSLDDKVAKWFPQLTRANEISIRQLLSMTSGYQDYWPEDFVRPEMQRPATADYIMTKWAGKALDFEPGTKWQYSNTNYVIAAAIVEKVSGMPFFDFLRARIFTPLRMTSVTNIDLGPLPAGDAPALLRNAMGPLRPAPKEGKGWLFGAGQLAMTSHDLSLWNIAMMNRALLKPVSYDAQQTSVALTNGTLTGYGLGINVGTPNGRKRFSHGGAVSGFTTSNEVYPDVKTAVVVFTNIYPGGGGASGQIANRISNVLFANNDTTGQGARTLARSIYDDLLQGKVDRSLFTESANAYFSAETITDYQKSLGALGAPTEFASTGSTVRGGLILRFYRIRAGGVILSLTTMTEPDGKIQQYIVERSG